MVPYHPQISDGKVFDDCRLSKRVGDWGSSVPGNSPASCGGGARAAAPQGGFRRGQPACGDEAEPGRQRVW